MPLTQARRTVAVSSPLGEDVLVFRRMGANEHLSRLFEYRLDLYSKDPAIKLEDLLGQNMTVRLELPFGETPRYFNGFVSAFSQVGTSGRYAVYRATLRPWLWFLTRAADCRIFQEMTVPDIVQQVFREHGLTDFDVSLSGQYRQWEYCVQYRETDFTFVSRLMEQEGIYYYFKHQNGKHTLVMCDSYGGHEPVGGYEEIPYFPPDECDWRRRDHIYEWAIAQEVQTGTYALNAFDYKVPKKNLLVNVVAPTLRQHDGADFEVYDYPGEYVESSDGDNYARIRIEELQAQYERVQGRGDARGLAVGALFRLTDFPRDDQNREYLLVGASYELESDEYESTSTGGGGAVYACRFTAMDAQQPYRAPRVTPKPVVQGPQTAVVVGKAGEELWTDAHGRVKVQFHWDRYGKADENSSCWMRVAQVWAGKKWGGMYVPRIGQEVIVDFLEGDPDRPIVTGRVYNGDNMPPYGLPDNKTMSVLKSNSSKGGGGFNEIRLEDKKGEEQLFIHGEKDFDLRVKNDRREFIGKDRHLLVKNDRFDKIENSAHLEITSDRMEKVGGNSHLTVGGDRMTAVDTSDNLAVAGDWNVESGADTNLSAGANHNQKVGQKFSLEAGMDIHQKTGMNFAAEGGMAVHVKGGMAVVIEGGTQLSLKVGGNFIDINPSGIFIQGTMVMINSGGAAGAGGGCSPTAPAAPTEPNPPQEPKEADTAEPGGMADVKVTPAQKQGVQLGSTRVKAHQNPQARMRVNAATDGTPFCEECERARRELAVG